MSHALRRFLLLCAFTLPFGSCAFDPEKRLDAAIERYREGKPNAMKGLEEEYIRYISTASIEGNRVRSTGTVIYEQEDDGARIILPARIELSMIGAEGARHIDMSDRHAVISDERQISIFDSRGGHIVDITAGDEKKPVLNCTVVNESVIYYHNFGLYRHAIADNASEALIDETFPPPYRKYYTVTFYRNGSLLGIAAGIAGSYHFSIVDLADNRVVLKNLQTSSSKLHMGLDAIHYITGTTGAWQLTRWTFADKSKKNLSRFTDISDIELTGEGYIREYGDGLEAASYDGETIPIPFPFELAGNYRDGILIRYGSRYHVIDFVRMLSGLKKMRDTAPVVFSGGDQNKDRGMDAK